MHGEEVVVVEDVISTLALSERTNLTQFAARWISFSSVFSFSPSPEFASLLSLF